MEKSGIETVAVPSEGAFAALLRWLADGGYAQCETVANASFVTVLAGYGRRPTIAGRALMLYPRSFLYRQEHDMLREIWKQSPGHRQLTDEGQASDMARVGAEELLAKVARMLGLIQIDEAESLLVLPGEAQSEAEALFQLTVGGVVQKKGEDRLFQYVKQIILLGKSAGDKWPKRAKKTLGKTAKGKDVTLNAEYI